MSNGPISKDCTFMTRKSMHGSKQTLKKIIRIFVRISYTETIVKVRERNGIFGKCKVDPKLIQVTRPLMSYVIQNRTKRLLQHGIIQMTCHFFFQVSLDFSTNFDKNATSEKTLKYQKSKFDTFHFIFVSVIYITSKSIRVKRTTCGKTRKTQYCE